MQSIYEFRGSSPLFMRRMRERIPEAGVFNIATNYRCSQKVLELCNDVLERVT
jgi:superfamily I DNA/RNA helicase